MVVFKLLATAFLSDWQSKDIGNPKIESCAKRRVRAKELKEKKKTREENEIVPKKIHVRRHGILSHKLSLTFL